MLTHGSLFTGIGLLDYGLCLAGLAEPEWVCERDEWRRESILAQRFPGAIRYDDVRRVGDGCGVVDLIAGGFPCKGASTAGLRNGFDHPETVLWREMARAVGELRPRYVLVENVANILALHDGAVWGEVLGDLASLGFDVVWDCLPAAAVGAPHLRDRVFAIASHSDGAHERRGRGQRRVADGWANAGGSGDCVAANAASERRAAPEPEVQQPRLRYVSGAGADRRGVSVEWGAYAAAIRRWESRSGPAPEPLLRRVDDRSTARLERSRVSAVGDGVQVQIGAIAGAHILQLERERTGTPERAEGAAA